MSSDLVLVQAPGVGCSDTESARLQTELILTPDVQHTTGLQRMICILSHQERKPHQNILNLFRDPSAPLKHVRTSTNTPVLELPEMLSHQELMYHLNNHGSIQIQGSFKKTQESFQNLWNLLKKP